MNQCIGTQSVLENTRENSDEPRSGEIIAIDFFILKKIIKNYSK